MRKLFFIAAALLLAVSCEEWEPVFTTSYDAPATYEKVTLTPTHTIAQLATLYTAGSPIVIKDDIIIGGKVTTTDQPGNFYKSFFIQDETGGIEIKVGRNSLNNDYKPGQWVYVKCRDLTLGMYGFKTGNYGGQGMLQIGFKDPTGSYETSYLEAPLLIHSHIVRGEIGSAVEPEVITEKQLPKSGDTVLSNMYIGKLVTLKGLKYAGEVFCLLYLDSTKDKKLASNRVFLSDTNPDSSCDKTHGVTTWAMSKVKMTEYIKSGIWDDLKVGSGSTFTGQTIRDFKGDGSYPGVEKAAYSVSQYFKMGSTEIQLRTSGYSKFGDNEIPAEVRAGTATVDLTGILSLYQGSIQFTVNSLDDIKINK